MTKARPWWHWPGPSSRKHKVNTTIIAAVAILMVVGLVLQYIIGPGLTPDDSLFYFKRHFVSVLLALAALVAGWKVPLKLWIKYSPALFIGAIILCFFAIAIDGLASRWIQIGFFSFQPVELIKLAFALGGGAYLAQARSEKDFTTSWKPVSWLFYALAISTFVVVLLQRDLGSMVVIGAMALVMLFVSGFSLRLLGLATLVGLVLVSVFIFSTPYRRDRFNTFLNPQEDCQDEGYHACQAVIAVGSGGLFGRGVGKSRQIYGYVPEANNDSIFAIYAEVIGFVGSIALFAVLYRLYSAMYKVASQSEIVLKLIATGIVTWLSVQTIMNIGAMIGLLPLKGITLPYISYGGSSLMLVLLASGILLQISGYTVYSNERRNQNSPGRRRVRRSHYTNRYTR